MYNILSALGGLHLLNKHRKKQFFLTNDQREGEESLSSVKKTKNKKQCRDSSMAQVWVNSLI